MNSLVKLYLESMDTAEFKLGVMVEFEHTDDQRVAIKIAKDHLSEDPKYYSKLWFAGLIDEGDAVEYATKMFGPLEEMTTSGALPGYSTPYAFKNKDKK